MSDKIRKAILRREIAKRPKKVPKKKNPPK
jgi:hypothetical protein